MKIALCLSGHLRGFDKCLENILLHLIEPLRKRGQLDIFCATWNTQGYRDSTSKWNTPIENLSILKEIHPQSYIIEEEKRHEFINTYKAPYIHSRYSCFETSGDATSMWYLAKRCFSLLGDPHKYDLIVRARFDIIYDQEIIFPLEIQPKIVYMPESHGKYHDATMGYMDHFAYGDSIAMQWYFSTFDHISLYLEQKKSPFTAEGFLYHTIHPYVQRFPLRYSVQRKNHIERVV